jgi:hypothetical protein
MNAKSLSLGDVSVMKEACGKSIVIAGVGVGIFRSEVAFFWVPVRVGGHLPVPPTA